MNAIIQLEGSSTHRFSHHKNLLTNPNTLVKWLIFYIATSIASMLTLATLQLNLFQSIIHLFIEQIIAASPKFQILLYLTRSIGLITLRKLIKADSKIDFKIKAIAIGELLLELVFLYINMDAALNTSYTITHMIYMAFVLADYISMFAVILGNALYFQANVGLSLYINNIANPITNSNL